MIPIAKPILGDEERAAMFEVIDSGQLVEGPKVREFEERFAEFCHVGHAIATSSGTAALHIALLAHEIGPSDEVITSPLSFVASANCALYVGARPVFADIEPDYYTLDPTQVERQLTDRTRAIIPVHLYGQACDMDAIAEIAQKHHLAIIEDACQAHGAKYKGQSVGVFGTACFSFYATKNIITIEGGMIVTNNTRIAERARMIRNHGGLRAYEHLVLGYNLRMTDLTAAIGLVQLKKLAERNAIRRANASYLTENLSGSKGIVTPKIRDGSEHVFHQYTIRISNRGQAVQRLREQEIGFGIHYPKPIYQQPLYQKLGYSDYLPKAEEACREVLSLPVHPSLSKADLDKIIQVVAGL